MILAQIILVLLHHPGGAEVIVNPRHITSMHSSVPGKDNEYLTTEARCMINTSDGKFLSVIETCDTVRRIMGLPVPKSEAKK